MKLKFLHLTIRDFKSFVGAHQLPLDLPIGVHFIRGRNEVERRLGSNGSGKSTIWDALVWTLFGHTPAGLRNPDVQPWTGMQKGTRVSLLMSIDGERVTVTRTASPNQLRIDGKDVGQDAIVKLIGMTFETMTNTIILGQDSDLFFDKSPRDKMQLLSDVKQLDRWDARSKAASDKTQDLAKEQATLTGEVTGLERSVQELASALKELAPKEEEWQQAFETRQQEADKFVRKHGKRMKELQNDVAKFDLKYDGAMTEVKQCERQVKKLGDEVRRAEVALAEVRGHRRSLNDNIDRWMAERLTLCGAKRCPTCHQLVKKNQLDKHDQHLTHQIYVAETTLKKLRTKPIKAALATAQSSLEHVSKYLEVFHAKADGALRDHKEASAQLNEFTERLRQIKKLTDDGETNPYSEQKRKLRKRRNRLLSDIDVVKGDMVSCARELERTKYWVKGFKDIKLHVVEELLQELELATAGMLEEVGLIGWQVRYDIERETKSGTTQRALSVMIGSPRSKGKLVKWESWSGGEAQRLRVIGALALASVLLNHAGVEPSMEVLDEPTQHLSDEGRHDLCDYLAERAQSMRRRIFYCDHQSVDSATFESTITVRRDDNGSRIVR